MKILDNALINRWSENRLNLLSNVYTNNLLAYIRDNISSYYKKAEFIIGLINIWTSWYIYEINKIIANKLLNCRCFKNLR